MTGDAIHVDVWKRCKHKFARSGSFAGTPSMRRERQVLATIEDSFDNSVGCGSIVAANMTANWVEVSSGAGRPVKPASRMKKLLDVCPDFFRVDESAGVCVGKAFIHPFKEFRC